MRPSKKSSRSKPERAFNPETVRDRRSFESYPEILREYASSGFRDDPRGTATDEPIARKK